MNTQVQTLEDGRIQITTTDDPVVKVNTYTIEEINQIIADLQSNIDSYTSQGQAEIASWRSILENK